MKRTFKHLIVYDTYVCIQKPRLLSGKLNTSNIISNTFVAYTYLVIQQTNSTNTYNFKMFNLLSITS